MYLIPKMNQVRNPHLNSVDKRNDVHDVGIIDFTKSKFSH